MKNQCDTVKKKLDEMTALNQQMKKENKRLEQSCVNALQSEKGKRKK